MLPESPQSPFQKHPFPPKHQQLLFLKRCPFRGLLRFIKGGRRHGKKHLHPAFPDRNGFFPSGRALHPPGIYPCIPGAGPGNDPAVQLRPAKPASAFFGRICPGGPRQRRFARYNTRCLVCELRVEEQIYRRVEGLIAAFCTEYPRYRYGFLGLPLVALQIPRSCRRRFVCSQFVAFLLSRSGALRLRKDYSLMRPQDFSALEEPRPFFRGSLREYLRQVRPASQRMGRRPGFYAAGASADGMPFSGPMPM